MIDPSSGRTLNALFGSTWSRIHRPSGTNCRSLGWREPATLYSFSTRLLMIGGSAARVARAVAATAAIPARNARRDISDCLAIPASPRRSAMALAERADDAEHRRSAEAFALRENRCSAGAGLEYRSLRRP